MNKLFHIASVVALLFLLTCNKSHAQAKLKAANRQFEQLSYIDAIRLYEEFLRDAKDPATRQEGLKRLAYSYRKVQDSRNAERAFEIGRAHV